MQNRSEADDLELAQLFISAQGGDADAYNEALRRAYSIVEAFVKRRVSSKQDAEDLTQEIVVLIHRGRHSYIPGRPIRPWLFAIARNRLYDHFRALGISRKNTEALLSPCEPDTESPETRLEGEELHGRIQTALSSISDNQRKAIELMNIQGKSAREAADELGTSETTVRVWLHRALKQLKEALKDHE